MDRITILQNTIDRAARLYYYTGTPIITDEQYDALIEELKILDPTDLRITKVGANPPDHGSFEKFTNTASTNSLAKADTESELNDWYERALAKGVTGGLMVELKADGATALAYYVDGILDRVVTRGGDEGVGVDITKNAVKFKGIPHILANRKGQLIKFTGAIRGEAILFYEDYAKIDPKMASNVRNIGNGIVNRQDGTDSELITFLAFNFEEMGSKVATDGDESDKLTDLYAWGFTPVLASKLDNMSQAIGWWKGIDQERKAGRLQHAIDGVVFKINNLATAKKLGISSQRPNSEIVLKFEAPGAETKVIGMTYTVGHTGAQIPTAILETVVIDNTNVSNAQLNNWDLITAMDIAIGDRVRVIKAKDLIPYLESVIDRPVDRIPIPEPIQCFVCKGPAGRIPLSDGGLSAQTFCLNPDCPAKSIGKINNWINKHNILEIGEETLRGLVEKFDMGSPADLYRLTIDEMAGVMAGKNLIGLKNATKIYNNIQATRTMSLDYFLGSLGIRFLGRRATKLAREKVPGQLDTLEDWRSGKIAEIDCGMPNKAPVIMEDINKMAPVIDDLLQFVNVIEPSQELEPVVSMPVGVLAGMSFCMTGTLSRKKAEIGKDIVGAGGTVLDEVKKGLSYLVVADGFTSNKTAKAEKLGVKVISEGQLMEMLK